MSRKLSLEVRAVIQETQVAKQLGCKISCAALERFYGKENVDRARLDSRFCIESVIA